MDQETATGSETDMADQATDPSPSDENRDENDHGVYYIPGKVVRARAAGETVTFVTNCRHGNCWYWRFEDGSRLYRYEPMDYADIARHHNPAWKREDAQPSGSCPWCGNTKTTGGFMSAEDVKKMLAQQD